jgi:hypothetical protein
VAYQRDPLSVRFDAAAARFVTRMLQSDGGWVETTVVPPSDRFVSWALARDLDPLLIRYTGRGSGIETGHEAAFRRAVFYDIRIYLWARPWRVDEDGPVRNPERTAAVEFRWARRTAAGRIARARSHPVASASRWAAKNDPYGR